MAEFAETKALKYALDENDDELETILATFYDGELRTFLIAVNNLKASIIAELADRVAP